MPAEIRPEPAGRMIRAGDVGYHIIEMGEAAHPGQAPAVFLHGGGPGCTSWTDFGPVAPMFAADRACILVDLLQYGRSEKCPISGPMWDFHTRTIVDLLDALSIDRADFVCNSWGGTIALNLAAKHPDRARSLVVTGSMPVLRGPLGPLPQGGRRGRPARDAYFGGDGPTEAKMRALMAELEWYDEAEIPPATVTARYLQSIDPDEMALSARSDSPRGEQQDLSAELAKIRGPVLFAWGMYDAFLTPDYALMLAAMVEHGQLYVMDKASHHLQEERPQHYHSVVSGFLDQEERRDEREMAREMAREMER